MLLTQKVFQAMLPQRHVCIAAVVGMLSLPALALEAFTAEYDLSWDVGINLTGTASQALTREAEHWRFDQRANASVGSLQETSLFREQADGQLLPLEFARATRVLGRKKEQNVRFNWNQNTVQMDDTTLELDTNVFDPLTLQLALRKALIEQASLDVKLADRGRIKDYPIDNLGLTRVMTRNGPIEAVQLRYQKNESSQTDLWFDPERDYLMVALKSVRDGKVFTLSLRSATVKTMEETQATTQ